MTQPGVGTNRYAYAANDPVNLRDANGNLVIFVDGTESDGAWREDDVSDPNDLFSQVENTYGETPEALGNTEMPNRRLPRTTAATALRARILQAIEDGDEQIVIIAHSHGVNVAKLTSQMGGVQIDQIVGLGGPVRSDYRMNMDNVENYLNVYSTNDAIQEYGGMDGSMLRARTAGKSAERIDPQATRNIDASTVMLPVRRRGGLVIQSTRVGHFWGPATIHGPIVWMQHIAPTLNN